MQKDTTLFQQLYNK